MNIALCCCAAHACARLRGQAERISALAILEILRLAILVAFGLDIPPIFTDLIFSLPNSRPGPALSSTRGLCHVACSPARRSHLRAPYSVMP